MKHIPDPLKLYHLKTLTLKNCYELKSIPESLPSSLEYLDLSNCFALTELPNIVGQLPRLNYLDISYCENLIKIPANLEGKIDEVFTTGCLAFPCELSEEALEEIRFEKFYNNILLESGKPVGDYYKSGFDDLQGELFLWYTERKQPEIACEYSMERAVEKCGCSNIFSYRSFYGFPDTHFL